ncbi:MFS transporter [Oxalobacteraceae bacterium]|nr:MFS transporter [Oxalobacteraceae bacterium]
MPPPQHQQHTTAAAPEPISSAAPAGTPLLRDANFRWLMSGSVISQLGDQLSLIALPWLVLKVTGDTLALGLVIALMSIPRAVFILIGGALVDRYSPRRVLMLSKYANAALLIPLTLLVLNRQPELTLALSPALSLTLNLTPHITLMIVYALALAIGLAQAFAIPAATSILPQTVAPAQLEKANGIMMGMRQLTMLAGPLLAALLIALSGSGQPSAGAIVPEANGLALAFGLDCLSFLISAWTLSHVTSLPRAATHTAHPIHAAQMAPQSVWRSVGAGLAMVWNDMGLRLCFLYWGTVSLLIGGAMQVALPVLADTHMHGAASLGLLMGANGAGMLLGMALAAAKGAQLRRGISFGSLALLIDALAGAMLLPLAAVRTEWQAATVLLLIGVLSGFIQITVFSWIQRRVPPQMMGRAMSIFMFIFMGLAPLSAAGTGLLLKTITLGQLFAGGGILLLGLAALMYLLTPMRHIDPPAAVAKRSA